MHLRMEFLEVNCGQIALEMGNVIVFFCLIIPNNVEDFLVI